MCDRLVDCVWLQARLEVFLKELESERQLKIDEVIITSCRLLQFPPSIH